MKLLITGSQGQLGSELQSILKTSTSEIGKIPNSYKGCKIYAVGADTLDITNFASTQIFIQKLHPDIIINCAAMTNVDECEQNCEAAIKVNSIGPRNIAICAQEINAKLVHISTDYVFSGKTNQPYQEWDIPQPQTVYGKSKLLGEKYVTEFCQKSFIIRTAWLYGYIGNNFVKTILRLAREKANIKVVNDQIGNPTNANDLAYHILLVALTDNYGIYHCTNEGVCSWYDFARKIIEYAKIPCSVISCTTKDFPRPATRPVYSALDNLMLRSTVGNLMRPWEEALYTYIEKLIKF